jgi:hypothetical protein
MKRKTAQPPPPASLPPATHEQVTQRAHRLWIESGRPEGRDGKFWAEAERQLSDPSDKREPRRDELAD